MRFSKLHIAGFKTFVEATDFLIEPGLTGVVGPNGCGKSNLVEAMRWVMGENSFKNMRASGMDDVIFSGSGGRPARNVAEVGLVLDNADRTAPALFNDADVIEVTRRIEREAGSTYRVNGREVRARDVQLLFADASSGARSPAMVRQGQIGEIISAKPQARRRVLEEAAGISGLHSRRHEAELRLRAAEDNMARLDDVLKQIEGQADSLRRQARQSARYKNLAAEIRKTEALIAFIQHSEATQALTLAERKLEADIRDVAEQTRLQAETARLHALAAHDLPAIREAETAAAGGLQRLILAREALDGEEKRLKSRVAELERRIAQMTGDLARETALIDDAVGVLAKLDAEQAELDAAGADTTAREDAARAHLTQLEAALSQSEASLNAAQSARSDVEARRAAFERALREDAERLARFEIELQKVEAERAQLTARFDADGAHEDFGFALDQAIETARACEEEVAAAEAAHANARDAETRARGPLAEAERQAQRAETEVATLSKLLSTGAGGFWPPVTEAMTVEKGYEAALGAALGDDLEASTTAAAPAHWAQTDASKDLALPPGVEPLGRRVTAPAALQRRLAQIGVVLRGEGPQLRALLRPGQRLVSKEGDLWRWDGFSQAAEAPTPAARRLVEKNRLGDLMQQAKVLRAEANALKGEAEALQNVLRTAGTAEAAARQEQKAALRDLDTARERNAAAERKRADVATRLSALEEAHVRLAGTREEAREKRDHAAADLQNLAAPPALMEQLETAQAAVIRDRAAAAEARGELQGFLREAQSRTQRATAIAQDRSSWEGRSARAKGQIDELQSRLEEARDEQEKLAEAPDAFYATRRNLMNQIEAAEAARSATADARAVAETQLAAADKAARAALEAMSTGREEKARSEARFEAATLRLAEIERAIATDLECAPAALAPLAGLERGAPVPDVGVSEQRLESLKQDRERLGAVNLRADEELAEVEASRSGLAGEREDLTEAIRRLRQAIANLNKEGRERLLSAFELVNGHFKTLFATLFGGGSAELQLIESDDPLEAGLEILARPPGKKPQVMTLLSGGEQALTAMSLIFAVFLTNPSPICVLDEVDAPLDDANVERFCDLLEAMRQKTDTRFVTITHNPITMARMDRLFGVTMAERGVSQLVSVDLTEAERFLEAV